MCRAEPGFTRSARQALRWRRHLLLQQKPADFAAEPRRVYNSRYSIPDGIDEGTSRLKLLSGLVFLFCTTRRFRSSRRGALLCL